LTLIRIPAIRPSSRVGFTRASMDEGGRPVLEVAFLR
jgi:hypothetical protein